jgi:hypothetical protein
LPHCFSACTRKARGGPILTITPAFDGLKVFPSLAGLSISRFGLLERTCQSTSASARRVSALAPQSGGLRGRINAEVSTYLYLPGSPSRTTTDYIFAFRPNANEVLVHGHARHATQGPLNSSSPIATPKGSDANGFAEQRRLPRRVAHTLREGYPQIFASSTASLGSGLVGVWRETKFGLPRRICRSVPEAGMLCIAQLKQR